MTLPSHLMALVVLLETQRRLVALMPPRWGMTELGAMMSLPYPRKGMTDYVNTSDSCVCVARSRAPE